MTGVNNKVAISATEFTLDVYKEVVKKSSDNIFMSPSSILVVMAMLHAGAKNRTQEQMTKTLHFGTKTEEDVLEMMTNFMSVLQQGSASVTLKSANRLYPHTDKSILQEYIDLISKHYKAEVKSMNYTTAFGAARKEINQWVEEETNNKIKQLLPAGSLNPLTAMVVVNAIYFKGNWATQFDSKRTKSMPFHSTAGEAKVDMMRKEIKMAKFSASKQLNCEVLELPYIGEEVTMIFILPNDKDGLPSLEKQLTLENMMQLRTGLGSQKMDVGIPKFKLESSHEMKDVLSSLGMPDAFDMGKADFSGMGKDLVVSKVFHKAFVDVNEEGTEAAAATAAVMMKRSLPTPPRSFIADHPFMFLIWDLRLNAPLFIGRFVNPGTLKASKDEL